MDKDKLAQLGVDYEMAVKRFAGNEKLYEKYLDRFKDDEHLRDADSAMERQDYQEVLEQIHAFKGVFGTLGMDDLYEKSQVVVSAIRAGDTSHLEEQMKDVHVEYDKIMKYYE